ncbi:hypothetical protein Aab01nite_00810 [Paractinoplanes abujensis]|nr:hypothetical protein Aab01nite_00810 [Actinoplanes abujensis]
MTALLGAHPGTWTTTADDPCPSRTSQVVTSAGHALRLRADPGPVTLIHLCAGPSMSRVREWRVAAGEGVDAELPVLRVGNRLALTAAALRRQQDARLTVDAVLESGSVLHFDTRLTTPATHP